MRGGGLVVSSGILYPYHLTTYRGRGLEPLSCTICQQRKLRRSLLHFRRIPRPNEVLLHWSALPRHLVNRQKWRIEVRLRVARWMEIAFSRSS